MLSAINLTKKFGDLLVLDDITETIKEGEGWLLSVPAAAENPRFCVV